MFGAGRLASSGAVIFRDVTGDVTPDYRKLKNTSTAPQVRQWDVLTSFESGRFLSSASSKHVESGVGIVVRPAKGSALPRQVADAAGSVLSLDDLRTWFAPVSKLTWKVRKTEVGPLIHEFEFIAEQNGLILALVLPLGSERDEKLAEREIHTWISENLVTAAGEDEVEESPNVFFQRERRR